MKGFDVETNRQGSVVRVVLTGDLDLSTAEQAEQEILRAEESQPPLLLLDLRGLSFMDSTGLRVVASADTRAQRDDRRVVIVQGPPAVRRVFEITRLAERLQIVESPEAVES